MQGTVVELLSAVGGIICVDGREGENIITAISDGACYPGYAVNVLSTTGVTKGEIKAVDIGADDRFVGILLPTYKQDCDALITDRAMCEVVIPQKGHYYNVFTYDLTTDYPIGSSVTFDGNAGRFVVEGSDIGVRDYVAVLSKWYDDDDIIMEICWVM